MRHASFLKAALMAIALLTASCAEKTTVPPPSAEYWTIAPENLVVELAAGNEVILNPAYADFPLFSNALEAKRAIAGKKGWAVFRLAETDCATIKENRPYLSRPSSVTTWEIP